MPDITLKQANLIIDATLNKGRELKLPKLTVAVVDRGGHLIALQRDDGATFMRPNISLAKAWGAIGLGVNSRDISKRYESGVREAGFINALNAMTGGGVIPLPGGVLIYETDGELCGAVGVSGAVSEDDEACALAGVEAAGLQARVAR
jgi:uncharacterized protein GlcG (DUF336 family)